jgi:hypothetical protein
MYVIVIVRRNNMVFKGSTAEFVSFCIWVLRKLPQDLTIFQVVNMFNQYAQDEGMEVIDFEQS